ncbi:MAG: heme biosynthesis protein HemY [Paracoccaceae bacterium]
MIWSLLKIVVFVALVALVTLVAGSLMETGGRIVLTFGDTEFSFGPLQAAILAGLTLIAVWLGLRILGLILAIIRFIIGDETAISRYFDRNRERKGFEALAEGMMALASGEGRLALAKAAKAERNLRRPELTNLLSAQAAEMAGDSTKATEIYKRLLSDDRTRFVGVRGLMKQKLSSGDTETALKLAETAFALKPRHEETQDVLLKLQAEKGDWSGARRTLESKMRHGNLPRDVYKRRDAVLALQQAKGVLDESQSIEAREAAISVNRASPDLIPAAVLAADGYVTQGKPKYATRLLKKAWEAQPHPDLAAAFARIAPDESIQARIKRFQDLVRAKPDHPEARLLMAELQVAAEDFPAARRALGDLVETEPTTRALTIMAAISRGQGDDDAVVRGWLARALSAPRGPRWICDNCQTVHDDWGPVCSHCRGFDTLSWRAAPPPPPGSVMQTDMLPLIVGSPAAAVVAEHVAAEDVAEEVDDIPVVAGTDGLEPEPVATTDPVYPPRADWAPPGKEG